MYTIKEAAARSGVGAPLIRAWERRYGVVTPPAPGRAIASTTTRRSRVLIAMRTLVDSGWTASEAARAIVAGEVAGRDRAVTGRRRRPMRAVALARPTAT